MSQALLGSSGWDGSEFCRALQSLSRRVSDPSLYTLLETTEFTELRLRCSRGVRSSRQAERRRSRSRSKSRERDRWPALPQLPTLSPEALGLPLHSHKVPRVPAM